MSKCVIHSDTQLEVGNTKTTSKRESRVRSWVFTYNNYSQNDITQLTQQLEFGCKYVFQEEVGKSGTPHLQGTLRWFNGKTFTIMKTLFPKFHLEPCKNWKKSVAYCVKQDTKAGKIYSNFYEPIVDFYDEKKETPFQKEFIELTKRPVTIDNYKDINWFWEPIGDIGKTIVARHMIINNPRILLVGGKVADIKCAIASCEIKPKVVIWNIARDIGDIDYVALEDVSDAMFFSTKYESNMCVYNYVTIIVLANFPPILERLSEGRFKVKKIISQ